MIKNITCIIAAHNEEKRIENVLKVISGKSLLSEIIVVDDGSRDNTAKIIKRFRKVKLISYKKNKGKTSALLTGIKIAKGDYIVLLDADIFGFNMKNLLDLVNPLIKDRADISISLRSKQKLNYNLLDLPVLLSGERAFRSGVIDFEQFHKLPGYGFESLFNLQALDKGLRVKFVPMLNVQNTAKIEKIGLVRGLIKEVEMGLHIVKTVGLFGCLRQMLFLRSLSID
jgi:glycosyltransferase involved in cell wall biosynthesis